MFLWVHSSSLHTVAVDLNACQPLTFFFLDQNTLTKTNSLFQLLTFSQVMTCQSVEFWQHSKFYENVPEQHILHVWILFRQCLVSVLLAVDTPVIYMYLYNLSLILSYWIFSAINQLKGIIWHSETCIYLFLLRNELHLSCQVLSCQTTHAPAPIKILSPGGSPVSVCTS